MEGSGSWWAACASSSGATCTLWQITARSSVSNPTGPGTAAVGRTTSIRMKVLAEPRGQRVGLPLQRRRRDADRLVRSTPSRRRSSGPRRAPTSPPGTRTRSRRIATSPGGTRRRTCSRSFRPPRRPAARTRARTSSHSRAARSCRDCSTWTASSTLRRLGGSRLRDRLLDEPQRRLGRTHARNHRAPAGGAGDQGRRVRRGQLRRLAAAVSGPTTTRGRPPGRRAPSAGESA